MSIGFEIRQKLLEIGIHSNLVSMPCIEVFERQSKSYKNKVLGNKPRVVIEAASTFGWYKYLNPNDLIFGIDSFGESGKGNQLFDHFSLTKENIYKKIIKKLLKC